MAEPDIIVSNRIGNGYLSTTFSDPTDYPVIFRKWIFGDGVIIEGSGLATINHTYYAPGLYTVILIDQTFSDQYTVKKEDYVIVNDLKVEPYHIIADSFDSVSGKYWRFYFDSYLHLIFEDNDTIFRSKSKIVDINKWTFVKFDRQSCKMFVGSFSYYIKEVDVVCMANMSPISFSDTGTHVLTDSHMKIDEIKIWSEDKDTTEYYIQCRGKAGYLDSIR